MTSKKAVRTRQRRVAGKKAALKSKHRSAGKKAAITSKRRASAMDAFVNKPNSNDEFYTEEGCWILEVQRDHAVTIARARVAPGVTTKAHSLRGIVERYLITAGKGIVQIGKRPPEEVGQGDVVTIPAEVSQRITNIGTTDLIFYCVCTPPFQQSRYKALE